MSGINETIAETARRHGLSEAAVRALADALTGSRGRLAQFSHPDLGGMGQWSGGMVQIGDMFNHALKAKVAAACADLAAALAGSDGAPPSRAAHQSQWQGGGGEAERWSTSSVAAWWPGDLGQPDATGGQNDTRYAYFADTRRLAVERDRTVTVYDTGEHRISGGAQQQGGTSEMSFASQLGPVRLGELAIVATEAAR